MFFNALDSGMYTKFAKENQILKIMLAFIETVVMEIQSTYVKITACASILEEEEIFFSDNLNEITIQTKYFLRF